MTDDLTDLYSTSTKLMKRSEIRELLKLTRKPDIISFAGGLPDPETFPVKEIKEACAWVLENESALALQYGPTEGDIRLRKDLAEFLGQQGTEVGPENILTTVASQQGLDLVGKVFLDRGDPIILSLPTYIGGLQAFWNYGAEMIGVALDDDGMDVDEAEKALKKLRAQGRRAKFIYVVPDFQNPAGVTLSRERRERLAKMAVEYDTVIIEDSPYKRLRFEGEHLPSIFSLAPKGRVVGLYTFSKIFCPGFRLGWMAAEESMLDKFVTAKQAVDLCTPSFTQSVVHRYYSTGQLLERISLNCERYRRKKGIMLDALEEFMPDLKGLSWTKPEGGLFLFARLPEHMDATDMFDSAIEEKVAYVIGSAFYADGKGRNTMRLNFSFPTEEQIVEGISRLGRVVADTAATAKSA